MADAGLEPRAQVSRSRCSSDSIAAAPTTNPGSKRLDVRGVAARWNTTELAIRKRVERRTIPFRRDGARVVFFADELERYEQALAGVGVDEAIARTRGEVPR